MSGVTVLHSCSRSNGRGSVTVGSPPRMLLVRRSRLDSSGSCPSELLLGGLDSSELDWLGTRKTLLRGSVVLSGFACFVEEASVREELVFCYIL